MNAGKLRRWTRAWLAWLPAAAGLGSEGLWVVNRHLASLNRLAKEISEVELRLAQVTEEDPVVSQLIAFARHRSDDGLGTAGGNRAV